MSRLVVLASLLLLGCRSSPPPATAAPAVPPPLRLNTTPDPGSPVQLSWQEVRREPAEVQLVARVTRLAPLPFPLEVSIALPPGATLTRGRARFTLPPNAEGSTHEEAVTVSYPSLPAQDLELTATGRAADMGINARLAYRFGRPAPLQPVVAPEGPDLEVGGRNFGPSVPIGPR